MSSIFKHGPQNHLTKEQTLFIQSLKEPAHEVMGCTDLSEGFDIVFDSWLPDIFAQVKGIRLTTLKTRFMVLGKNLFTTLDDDMELREEVQRHMQQSDWIVPVKLNMRSVIVNVWGEMYVSVSYEILDHPIFDDIPILNYFMRPDTLYQFKLGDCDQPTKQYEIYVEGSVYLRPFLLL